MIKALLEGHAVQAPEVSTLVAIGGPLLVGPVQTALMFTNGHWFVNPTDNSLWFVPEG